MFRNITVFTRLIILTGVMILALLINIWISWAGFRAASLGLEEVYHGSVEEISNLTNLRIYYVVNIADNVNKLRDDLIKWNQAYEMVKDAIEQIEITSENYFKNISQEDPNIKSQSETLHRHIQNAAPVIQKLLSILEHQDKEALRAFIVQDLYPTSDPIKFSINRLIKNFVEITSKDYEHSKSSIDFYKNLMIMTFILALLFSLLVSFLITKSIITPLSKAIDTVKKVSQGDLSIQIETNDEASKNEICRLLEAMGHMVETDKQIVHALTQLQEGDLRVSLQPRSEQDVLSQALNKMTKKMRQIIGSIQTDVVKLTNSSKEILDSISQVAIGSSETGTAVTETTTTVEELKQTAQVSAEKAKDVLSSAEDTMRVVKDSEKSLQSTITEMNQINEKMHTISEGIIKLSELSQTIGDIIDTVNDLAEQSNLLAVNAAIEAAKAGDQGKGFSVVAQEIRTLAEQSKAATVQVKSILNDIQNATSAAVLATEQGSKAVEKGVNQSSQTNDSMRELMQSIESVTQAANQIAISSQQQLIGVDQVNMAMNNINDATRQHIENMRTIENSVGAFNTIGQTLKQITDQYIIADSPEKISAFEMKK